MDFADMHTLFSCMRQFWKGFILSELRVSRSSERVKVCLNINIYTFSCSYNLYLILSNLLPWFHLLRYRYMKANAYVFFCAPNLEVVVPSPISDILCSNYIVLTHVTMEKIWWYIGCAKCKKAPMEETATF